MIKTEYIVPRLHIVVATCMRVKGVVEERLEQLLYLEEDYFIKCFHQQVEKDRHKAWHDHHVKSKDFQCDYIVLIYDSKFVKHPGKLYMHWLGPYIIQFINNGGAVQSQ